MRVLFGVIVGIFLTIAVAYFYDASQPAGDQRIVNWELVNQKFGDLAGRVREAWVSFRQSPDHAASDTK